MPPTLIENFYNISKIFYTPIKIWNLFKLNNNRIPFENVFSWHVISVDTLKTNILKSMHVLDALISMMKSGSTIWNSANTIPANFEIVVRGYAYLLPLGGNLKQVKKVWQIRWKVKQRFFSSCLGIVYIIILYTEASSLSLSDRTTQS